MKYKCPGCGKVDDFDKPNMHHICLSTERNNDAGGSTKYTYRYYCGMMLPIMELPNKEV